MTNAQIFVEGGAEIVDVEKIQSSKNNSENDINSDAVLHISSEVITVNLKDCSNERAVKKISDIAQVGIKAKIDSRSGLSIEEKKSSSKKFDASSKSTVCYIPPDNPYQFGGARHLFKILDLPSEYFSKILMLKDFFAFNLKYFSFKKISISTSDFLSVNTYRSVLFTRPPPIKV